MRCKVKNIYLHVYIMKKWYGDDVYDDMDAAGYVIDHMDNEGHNCCISNLCFLIEGENKAKGFTMDAYSKDKRYIALSLFKDFVSGLFQITIHFNYPAQIKLDSLESPALIDLAYLLYNSEYEIVINDARKILYDYRRDFSFEPEKLNDVDYHFEGHYGLLYSKERYERYISGSHGYGIFMFEKKAMLQNWTLDAKREYFYLHGKPNDNS